MKDSARAHRYVVSVLNWVCVLSSITEDSVDLWDTFKHEPVEAARECIAKRPRIKGGFFSLGTQANIEYSRAASLAGNPDQCMTLSNRARALVRGDTEKCVRSLTEDVEDH